MLELDRQFGRKCYTVTLRHYPYHKQITQCDKKRICFATLKKLEPKVITILQRTSNTINGQSLLDNDN